jgi:hypothetical protein
MARQTDRRIDQFPDDVSLTRVPAGIGGDPDKNAPMHGGTGG